MNMAYSSHNRKDPHGELDVSRTVGFFAYQFPLVLKSSMDGDLVTTLHNVQDALSTGVDNGFLQAAIKHLYRFSDDQIELQQRFNVQSQFSFTYVDSMVFHDSSDSPTLLIDQPSMLDGLLTMKSQNIFPHLFDFTVWNTSQGLKFTTHYNSKQFQTETVAGLLVCWKGCLLELTRI
ncbi:hypothetical protein BJ085DRAFT_32524 [Dimargaris cristalligena]|uniref:Condensation domain-containing protein n=1 Tax=Dimargaris cristalligena TaxID=215637 RepID=A0A4V1J3X8_9FUNG|nr:hypothetical protein BJ085DRAFT_32524 [Dimargaris cristalligena]|eukprot:RKP33609.1 hypothetical protein BJ085DRAFT_32524 [Dimargaris cristalligena]